MSSASKVKRKRKASTNAIREIKREQNKTSMIIPVAPLNRLTQEIAQEFKDSVRFKDEAHTALHIGVEDYLVELFQDANQVAIHNGRETVQAADLQLALKLRK